MSFAVTVIGGTALSGGTISALGFLFSGLLMALIRNGLIMIGVNVYFEATFLGVIILLAVMVEYFRLGVSSRARSCERVEPLVPLLVFSRGERRA